jgi:hypothetical protein
MFGQFPGFKPLVLGQSLSDNLADAVHMVPFTDEWRSDQPRIPGHLDVQSVMKELFLKIQASHSRRFHRRQINTSK